MSINIDALLEELDRRISERGMLKHPFYQAWTRGELSLDILRDYAAQYYRHVAAFPTYLSSLHADMENAADRRMVLQNLMDEEAGAPNHPELWMQFCGCLGLSRSQVEAAEPYQTTDAMVQTFRHHCRSGVPASGLAALYAYESQIPEVSKSKIDGLERHYGLESPQATEYFKIHIDADVEHASVERGLLASYITESNAPEIRAVTDSTLEALNGMLTGLCRRHGIAC